MKKSTCIRNGLSILPDPRMAVDELWTQIDQPNISLVIVFCSPNYNLKEISERLNELRGDTQVIGCTTAGELTRAGYQRNSITAASFAKPDFFTNIRAIEGVRDFSVGSYHTLIQEAVGTIKQEAPSITQDQLFAFLLVDGLCAQEEAIISCLYKSLGEIPIFGASAGDSLNFQKTHVLYNGQFQENIAIVILIGTHCPFRVFKTEHFVDSDTKMVVTEADPINRIVTEINGDPAGREYARLVGLPEEKLSPMIFAAYPVVVRVGGELYVRSIQKVNEDESLTFFCAIDEGIVLTVAQGVGLVQNLERKFEELKREVGEIQLIIGCDCILRRLELAQHGELEVVSKILVKNNVIGFNTYGEQFQAMHVNQTFTGVAIGSAK